MPGEEPSKITTNEIEYLRRQLEEANQTLEAIRDGEVDAIVVKQADGNQVFTLEGAERPYRLFVEEMQLGALTLGQDGTVLYCNRRFGQMVGSEPTRVAGGPFALYLSQVGLPVWQTLLAMGKDARAAGEIELQGLDGDLIPTYATVNPIQSPRGTLLAVVIADLTEQRHYERLIAAERSLRKEAARKDDFLAMLGHELRNPLVPIGNAVYLIQKSNHDPNVIEAACAIVERQVAHLARLVDDLLDVSRIARGKVRLKKEAMDLVETIRLVLEDHRSSMADKGLVLEVDLPPGRVLMEGDKARIVQVLSNLLQNAIKFTEAEGRVHVTMIAKPGGRCQVSVKDSGVGFQPRSSESIFEPFMQAEETTNRSPGGLGLGLALVKGIVEMHGGTVSAHSMGPGQGSEFTIQLPVLVPSGWPEATTAAPGATEMTRPRRILIVEDLVDSATTLQMVLARLGHKVEVARDGRAGLDKANHLEPHVVVCDIGLPGPMDGYDVAKTIRNTPSLAEAYLIALTGLGNPSDKIRAEQAGFNAHLTKPVDPAAWAAILEGIPDWEQPKVSTTLPDQT